MTTETKAEGWVLLKPDYSYIAIPATLAVEVLQVMRVVAVEYGGDAKITDKAVEMKYLTGDLMAVIMAKHRLIKDKTTE